MSISTEYANISMPSGADERFSIRNVDSEWFRLIPSRFPPINIYERVIANDRLEEVVQIENVTNPRLKSTAELTGGLHPIDPLSPRLQNWNVAPFAYSNPEGSRYFRPGYACLELAEDLQTALAISVRRRERFLGRTAEPAIDLIMRVLKTPVAGRFVDMRRLSSSLPLKDRWMLGDAVIKQGFDGVLFNSPERPSAACVAVLKESTLGRSQQAQHFHFVWDGRRISALYAYGDVREVLPETLSGADMVIAA